MVRGGGNQAISLEVFSPNKTRIEFIEKKGRGMWSGKAEELGDYEVAYFTFEKFFPQISFPMGSQRVLEPVNSAAFRVE